MYQQPGQNVENQYEAVQNEHERKDENYDRLHAGYSDEPRGDNTPKLWWQFWRRGGRTAGAAGARSAIAGSRPPTDPSRVTEFTRAVDEWIQLDAPAVERGAAFQALMARFTDVPSEQRQAIAAEALRRQGREAP
jgi:hypothetical protein